MVRDCITACSNAYMLVSLIIHSGKLWGNEDLNEGTFYEVLKLQHWDPSLLFGQGLRGHVRAQNTQELSNFDKASDGFQPDLDEQ